MTCKNTQEFLANAGTKTKTVVNATKTPLALQEVKEILKDVEEIVSTKGTRIETVFMRDAPGDSLLRRALLGPTGRLRAPAARIGKRLLVGFNEATYRETLG